MKDAAEIRLDNLRLLLGPYVDGDHEPLGGYHRTCYQTYTNKRLISRMSERSGDTDSEEGSSGTSLNFFGSATVESSVIVRGPNLKICLKVGSHSPSKMCSFYLSKT